MELALCRLLSNSEENIYFARVCNGDVKIKYKIHASLLRFSGGQKRVESIYLGYYLRESWWNKLPVCISAIRI